MVFFCCIKSRIFIRLFNFEHRITNHEASFGSHCNRRQVGTFRVDPNFPLSSTFSDARHLAKLTTYCTYMVINLAICGMHHNKKENG